MGSPLTPVAANDAVPKQYVDAQIGGSLGNATRNVRFFSNSAGGQGQSDGDIHVAGAVIYVWAANGWRQVFPAEYS